MQVTNISNQTLGPLASVRRQQAQVEVGVERLSSGKRISKAADGVADYSVSSRLDFRSAALQATETGIRRAVSSGYVIEQAASRINSMLIRMKVLAIQAASQPTTAFERALLNSEFLQVGQEIDRIAKDTEVGDVKVLSSAPAPILLKETFDFGAALNSDLILKGNTLPVVNAAGELNLTTAGVGNRATGVVYNESFVTKAGFQMEFRYFSSGPMAQGADGLTVFFVDEQYSDLTTGGLGAPAGGLMYKGIPYGALGIGFDEWGNFSINDPAFGSSSGGIGGPGRVSQSVVVRGPTSLQNPWYGTVRTAAGNNPVGPAWPGLGYGNIESPTDYRTVKIEVKDSLELTVEMDFEDGTGYHVIYDHLQLPTGILPERVKFGFGAATGGAGAANSHRVDYVSVLAGADATENFLSGAPGVSVGDDISPVLDRMIMPVANVTLEGLTLASEKIDTVANAESAMERIDFALNYLTEGIVAVAAARTAFEAVIVENLRTADRHRAAASIIADADVATEISNLAMHQTATVVGLDSIRRDTELRRRVILDLYAQVRNV